MTFRVHVRVVPRAGLLDPQGQAVEHALGVLGFEQAGEVRIGKAIDLTVTAASVEEARDVTRAMCERLLANPVMEDFTITVDA